MRVDGDALATHDYLVSSELMTRLSFPIFEEEVSDFRLSQPVKELWKMSFGEAGAVDSALADFEKEMQNLESANYHIVDRTDSIVTIEIPETREQVLPIRENLERRITEILGQERSASLIGKARQTIEERYGNGDNSTREITVDASGEGSISIRQELYLVVGLENGEPVTSRLLSTQTSAEVPQTLEHLFSVEEGF